METAVDENVGEFLGDASEMEKIRLDKQTLQQLSTLRPWRSFLTLFLEWFAIFATIAVCEHFFSWPLYVVAVVILGTRYHALATLVHDAAHYRICRNRKLNNWLGEVFMAWPLLITLHGYRNNHLKHHNHTNTDADPDWVRKMPHPDFQFPKTRAEIIRDLVKAAIGVRFITEVRSVVNSKELNQISTSLKRTRLAFYLCVVVASVAFGAFPQLFMYWLVPLMTSFSLFMYIRSAAEHFGGKMDYSSMLGSSRHVDVNFIGRLCFPYNVNYHLDHHLYPSVPFYNLPVLHKKLLSFASYQANAHITKGYFTGYYRECLKTHG